MEPVFTNLLSLGTCHGIILPDSPLRNSPAEFLEFCRKNIRGCENIQKGSITKNKVRFSKKEMEVLQEAKEIGIVLSDKTPEKKICEVKIATEANNDFRPYFILNKNKFFFLKNNISISPTELHHFLNILSGTPVFKKSEFHLFREFANNELNSLFEILKKYLISTLKQKSFERQRGGKYFKAAFSEETLILDINGFREYVEKFSDCNWSDFIEKTSQKYREGTLLQGISILLNDSSIKPTIQSCINAIGKNLSRKLESLGYKEHIKSMIAECIAIQSTPFYYIKKEPKFIEVFELPSRENFILALQIKDVKCYFNDNNFVLEIIVKNKVNSDFLVIKYMINLAQAILSPTTIMESHIVGNPIYSMGFVKTTHNIK